VQVSPGCEPSPAAVGTAEHPPHTVVWVLHMSAFGPLHMSIPQLCPHGVPGAAPSTPVPPHALMGGGGILHCPLITTWPGVLQTHSILSGSNVALVGHAHIDGAPRGMLSVNITPDFIGQQGCDNVRLLDSFVKPPIIQDGTFVVPSFTYMTTTTVDPLLKTASAELLIPNMLNST